MTRTTCFRSLVLALGLGLGAAALRAQDTVTVGVGGELSALPGQKLEVPVYADLRKVSGEKLGSYTVRVSWNPSILSMSSGSWNDGAFGKVLVSQDSLSNGVMWASGISAAGSTGVVDLFSFHLLPLDTVPDTVRVRVTELSAAGTLRDLLATAALVTMPGAYCKARGRWGDLDGDGLANSRDALAILSNVVGLSVGPFDLSLGDVDGDLQVNSRDALILLSYAVGLPIPGQRVLLVAGGACATGQTPEVTILPDTADLVVGQSVNIVGIAHDASGALVTLTGGALSSADPRIATAGDGTITGVEPGATVVMGSLGPGAQVAVPVIVRARRGTWYVDAQRAQGASVQLGNQRWPFATPQYAFPLASEGDTIRVAPGIVDYEGSSGCFSGCYVLGAASQSQLLASGNLMAGVVVVGDTLPDGTRPVLRAAEGDQLTGLPWYGGVHGEVRNLVLRGFYRPIYLYGLKSLVVDNVRIEEPQTQYGYGIYAAAYVDTVRVRRSELMADTSRNASYEGLYVNSGAQYVEVADTKMWYWGDGAIYGSDVDSLDVFRSDLSHTDYAGIYVSNSGGLPLNARISGNRITDNYYQALSLNGAGRIALDHNYIYERDDDALQIYGGGGCCVGAPARGAGSPAGAARAAQAVTAGTKLTMLGDSIQFRADDWNWLDVEDLDSLRVDSLWLENPADTAMYQYSYVYTNYARFTNSKLLNLYYRGIEFDGRELVVDNTLFTGCAVCAWTYPYGITAYAGNDSGPRLRVTNSRFFNLEYGIYTSSSNTAAGPMVVVNNTFDSVVTGAYLYGDSLAVTDNQFTRVRDYALYGRPGYTTGRPFLEAQVLRNQVSCAVAGYTSYGALIYDGPARFQDNVVNNCRYGLYAYNVSYPTAPVLFRNNTVSPDSVTYYRVGLRAEGKWQPTMVANHLTGGYYGIDLLTSDTSVTAVIDSNVVTGAGYAGLDLYYVNGPVSGHYNNIAGDSLYGIYNQYGTGARTFNLGRFVGNKTYAVYNPAATAFDATQNWWGDPAGVAGATADTVWGNVDASSPLASDPAGVTVPLAPQLLAAAARSPVRRDVTAVAPPSPEPALREQAPAPPGIDPRRAAHQARQAAKDQERAARRPRASRAPEGGGRRRLR